MFRPEPLEGEVFLFAPAAAVSDRAATIVALSGLEPRTFVLRAGNVPNAAATIWRGQRLVVYNTRYFDQLRSSSGGDWAWNAVLAHELGHHLNGHTLDGTSARPVMELEADGFAGFVSCKLGATSAEALEATYGMADAAHPLYPTSGARSEAILAGWRQALESEGRCPESALREPSGDRLMDLDSSVLIDEHTVARVAATGLLHAGRILFRDVFLTSDQPVTLIADVVELQGASGIKAPVVTIVARDLTGGSIDASGRVGEPGGKIAVAAMRVTGTVLVARGGSGLAGRDGEDGDEGRAGSAGRPGQCGPGIAGEWVDGAPGEPGGDGQAGEGGASGDPGAAGGSIMLLTFRRGSFMTDVGGGMGGRGGGAGRGGDGGSGGSGGAGCVGLGGHQPDRADGQEGKRGRDGRPGEPGSSGPPGQILEAGIAGIDELRELVQAGSPQELLDRIRERIRQ